MIPRGLMNNVGDGAASSGVRLRLTREDPNIGRVASIILQFEMMIWDC